MQPSFNTKFYFYTKNRKFTVIDILGWEKKHYIPGEPDLLGLKQDCLVYTAGDKKQMFTVTIDRDEVNLAFYFREKSDKASSNFGGAVIHAPCKIARAIHNDLPLNRTDDLKVHWGVWTDDFNQADETVRIRFESQNGSVEYDKFCNALEVFQRYCETPAAVLSDISLVIKRKKDSSKQARITLARDISKSPVFIENEIRHILRNRDMCSDSKYVLDLASWYAHYGNKDVAIFLCMSFPASNRACLDAYELAKKYLLSDESAGSENVHYMTRLSEAAFRIAAKTNNEDDVVYAVRVTGELELNNGFAENDLKSIDTDVLIDLLISKSVEIRHLKEKLKIELPASEERSSQAAVSGSALLTLSQNIGRVPSQHIASTTAKMNRRNSVP